MNESFKRGSEQAFLLPTNDINLKTTIGSLSSREKFVNCLAAKAKQMDTIRNSDPSSDMADPFTQRPTTIDRKSEENKSLREDNSPNTEAVAPMWGNINKCNALVTEIILITKVSKNIFN